MRRTLALAGAAALAVGFTGLAGPAAADSGITQAGQVVISEVGAGLDSSSPDHNVDNGFIELVNLDTTPVDVSGWKVIGCTTSGSFEVDIPSGTASIPVNGHYLVSELEFADASGSDPDQRFASGEVLEQAAGGAQLQDSTLAEVDQVMWGPNNPGVSCAITNAGMLPNDDESINFDASTDTYFLDTPTPQPSS